MAATRIKEDEIKRLHKCFIPASPSGDARAVKGYHGGLPQPHLASSSYLDLGPRETPDAACQPLASAPLSTFVDGGGYPRWGWLAVVRNGTDRRHVRW